ncbi:hypothetical protein GEMRC1_006539 [Eukaryota sp. GEM-RC1]
MSGSRLHSSKSLSTPLYRRWLVCDETYPKRTPSSLDVHSSPPTGPTPLVIPRSQSSFSTYCFSPPVSPATPAPTFLTKSQSSSSLYLPKPASPTIDICPALPIPVSQVISDALLPRSVVQQICSDPTIISRHSMKEQLPTNSWKRPQGPVYGSKWYMHPSQWGKKEESELTKSERLKRRTEKLIERSRRDVKKMEMKLNKSLVGGYL